MSYVVERGGDNYRGGYASSANFDPDEVRVATSTFKYYEQGTAVLVILIFITFLVISAFTAVLMCYARYLKMRKAKPGFYNPPPMITRYNTKPSKADPVYSTLSRSNYTADSMPRNAPSAMSHAASQQSEML